MLPPLNEPRTMEALDAALRSTAADEFEISVLARSGEYTRFAGQVIHQPQDIVEVHYLVRALVNGHPYRVATSNAATWSGPSPPLRRARAPGRSCRRRRGRSGWPDRSRTRRPDRSGTPTLRRTTSPPAAPSPSGP
jgi:hypothetical protein